MQKYENTLLILTKIAVWGEQGFKKIDNFMASAPLTNDE
jgi:hypothetical protein